MELIRDLYDIKKNPLIHSSKTVFGIQIQTVDWDPRNVLVTTPNNAYLCQLKGDNLELVGTRY